MSSYYYVYAEAKYKGKWYSINPIVKKADGTYLVKEVFWAQSGFRQMYYDLERVTRTAFEICSRFQPLQVFFARFAGENLNIQPHRAVSLGRDENLIHKGVDKFLRDLTVPAIPFGVAQNPADMLHVSAEFPARLLLIAQLGKLFFGGFDVDVTFGGH